MGTSGEGGRAGLLVASSGGHLLQLAHLRRHLPGADWHWVTFDTPDAEYLLGSDDRTYAYHPTNRNIKNLVRNTWLAVRLVRRLRPRIVISTGAGVAVPFCWVARLFGARIVYVESFARATNVSVTARLVTPVAHRLFVQWPEAASAIGRAEYLGPLF